MADKKASLTLELKDMASVGIHRLFTSIGGLKERAVALGSVIVALTAIIVKSISAYSEQEEAVNRLNKALENQGIKSDAVTKDLISYAQQLQNTTTYADDAILSAMALGVTFGITGEWLKRTTQSAIDLSAGLGIDLKTSMMLLGKAAIGETGTLSRYGIVISESIPKSERFAVVLEQINSRFGGSAASQAETYAGKMAQLRNTWSDMAEVIGETFVPTAIKAIELIKQTIEWWTKLISIDESKSAAIQTGIELHEREIKLLQWKLDRIKGISGAESEAYKSTQIAIENRKKAIAILRDEIVQLEKRDKLTSDKGRAGRSAPVAEDEETKKLLEKATLQIDTANLTENELANIRTNAMAQELIAKGEHNTAIQLLEAQQTANAKQQMDMRAKNLSSSLQFIATMSNSHNKTLAAIGKAAAISTATVDTYAAANKALASAPPPFNFALAALVTAAGISNVAQISGVKLAEGGMIMPSSGGTMATMAEAGRPEVAIPLDDDRTKDKLRDVFGGGSTIVINAGAVIADEYSLNEFVEKIDEKLYERQRNKRSYT